MEPTTTQVAAPVANRPKQRVVLIIGGILLLGSIVIVTMLFVLNRQQPNNNLPSSNIENTSNSVNWQLTASGWQAMGGTAPACPTPLNLQLPVDASIVTSILYPGQTRGGNYKPHGGFRFDNVQNNSVEVRAPMAGKVVNGGRYLVDGEIQYTFDIINPCGIMYRLGHLRELSPAFQALVTQFPEAKEGDSRTTNLNPTVSVAAGDLIATKVGIVADGNTFVDWGVYDLRQKNESSQDSAWASSHEQIAHIGLCWFDLLNASNEATVRSLPAADPGSGKNSDYCK